MDQDGYNLRMWKRCKCVLWGLSLNVVPVGIVVSSKKQEQSASTKVLKMKDGRYLHFSYLT